MSSPPPAPAAAELTVAESIEAGYSWPQLSSQLKKELRTKGNFKDETLRHCLAYHLRWADRSASPFFSSDAYHAAVLQHSYTRLEPFPYHIAPYLLSKLKGSSAPSGKGGGKEGGCKADAVQWSARLGSVERRGN